MRVVLLEKRMFTCNRPVETKKILTGAGSSSKNVGQLGQLTKKIIQLMLFNPNLGWPFRVLFCCGGWGWWGWLKLPYLKIVSTHILQRKYTHICSFRKYTFQYQGFIYFVDVIRPCARRLASRLLQISQNKKVTMTSSFANITSSSSFSNVAMFLWSILDTGPSFMSISLLVLELWQFFCEGLNKNPKIGNTTVWVLSNIWKLG